MRTCVVVALLLIVPLHVALANDAAPPNADCDSVLCVLMPVYKAGRSLLNLDPEPKTLPPPPPEALDEPPPPTAGNTASGGRPAAPATAVSTDANARSNDGGDGDHELKGPPMTGQLPKKRAASRIASSHVSGTRKVATRHRPEAKYLEADNRASDRAISIGADGPELALIRSLGALIDKPRIKVVDGRVDACTGKPVDFVVDALQNPKRRGPAIPLFDENLLILAGNKIGSIDALRGRKVSFGPLGSPSAEIARRVFQNLAIGVEEMPLDFDNAVDGLTQGAIDGVAVLMPRGSNKLASIGAGIHLLSVPNQLTVADGMRTSLIDPASYLGASWSHSIVRVLTVDAVLSPNPDTKRPFAAPALFASLDRNASRLAQNGFDLIGGDKLITMRSIATDPNPRVDVDASSRGVVGLRCRHR